MTDQLSSHAQGGKRLLLKNYKILIKESKDDTDRYVMFFDCKNQYCENDYYSKQSTDSMQSL